MFPPGWPPIEAASDRLLATVDALSDDQLRAPSVLPDWSRGHVVAHLVLNAEGLAGALTGLAAGEPTPIYASGEARDADIESARGGAGRTPSGSGSDRRWPGSPTPYDGCRRRPGPARSTGSPAAPPWPPPRPCRCGTARWRSTTPTSTPATAAPTGRRRSRRRARRGDPRPGRGRPVHGHRDGPRPELAGRRRRRARGDAAPARAIGWWLVGRGGAAGLTCDTGPCPTDALASLPRAVAASDHVLARRSDGKHAAVTPVLRRRLSARRAGSARRPRPRSARQRHRLVASHDSPSSTTPTTAISGGADAGPDRVGHGDRHVLHDHGEQPDRDPVAGQHRPVHQGWVKLVGAGQRRGRGHLRRRSPASADGIASPMRTSSRRPT